MKAGFTHIFICGFLLMMGCEGSGYETDHFACDDIFDFYKKQSEITFPGKYKFLYDDLPDDPKALVNVIQGILISEGLAYSQGISESDVNLIAYDLTRIEDILGRINDADNRSLTIPRKPENRLFGICSNFATLYCSILREKNIPSRVRSGYLAYFSRNRFVNHYVCEYWDQESKKWVAVDAELPNHLQITIDNFSGPEDMPEFTFISAGFAWTQARRGVLDPFDFGLGNSSDWESFGWDMLRPGVYSDFMALNKFEMHPWDVPLIWEREGRIDDEFIDSIAEFNKKDEYFAERIKYFISDKRMKLPRKINRIL